MTHSSLRTGSLPRSRAPTLCPMTEPGSLPGISLAEVAVEERLELERPKSIDQVRSRLLAPCPASTAEFRRGQVLDDLREAAALRARTAPAASAPRDSAAMNDQQAGEQRSSRECRRRPRRSCGRRKRSERFFAATRCVRHNSSLPMGRTRVFFRRQVKRVAY